ncbi:unnamed protein product [Ambrosiozyma monospora]|uniref:Unnamed protein product n=1 Tax=Ambrosiozyma monospora TaxID=43982 RepID=A0ACB5U0R4_AMBMO|nr:unnamed protein product [Ambrosiozyma monospora]
MADLSPENEAQLAQFKEFTGYDESTEQEKVLKLLTVCNWNLEVAIPRYFDKDFPSLFDDSPAIPTQRTTPAQTPSPNVPSHSPPVSHGSTRHHGHQGHQAIAFDHQIEQTFGTSFPKFIQNSGTETPTE